MERLLQMLPAVKMFFLSQSTQPIILKKFFQNELPVAYLWRLHSKMSMFHTNIQEIRRERNSVLEVLTVLQSVSTIATQNRRRFPSLKTQRDP
jgi:hypothetical protein